jgi:hypothetical protein
MSVNIFEGGRRLRLAIQGLTIIIGAWSIVTYDGLPGYYFETNGPNDGWHFTKEECKIQTDAWRVIYDLPDDLDKKIAFIELCFRAIDFPDKRDLIPYRTDSKGFIWGGEAYDDEVSEYIERRAKQFKLTAPQQDALLELAKREYDRRWRENLLDILIVLAPIVFGLEIFGRTLGWIFKGFTVAKGGSGTPT